MAASYYMHDKVLKRLQLLEANRPEQIDFSIIGNLEDALGYPIASRISDEKQLDRSSQSSYDRAVLEFLTTDELKRLAQEFPL